MGWKQGRYRSQRGRRQDYVYFKKIYGKRKALKIVKSKWG